MIEFEYEKLRRLGLSPAALQSLYPHIESADDGTRLMRVVEVHRTGCAVHDGDAELQAQRSPGEDLAVGDWVLIAPGDPPRVAQRLPPLSEVSRLANDGRRQVLASNVDTALLVMGLDADFNPRRVERYIAVAKAADVEPVVVLTKRDHGEDAAERVAELRRRLPASVACVSVDGRSPQARVELAPWLGEGHTLVLLGASGAGKSTLTNTLTGAGQRVGEVRHGDGRGKHTTTSRSLHRCLDGACLIDTPGLRSWQPDADARELAAAFDDIAALASRCRFADCTHQDEPGCAVRPHVDADRLANFRKMLRDANRQTRTPLEQIAERQKWKQLMKEGSARARAKRSPSG